MNSFTTLVSIGNFDFKLNHLLIIGILSLSFSISFMIRAQPADIGWELNEFDPFFNFRATEYIVENGIDAYFQWNDDLSWYPHGRNVSQTSQVMLHLTTALTYWIFGGNSNLYDFTILFPVIIGSLTCIVVFAFVRVIGGTTAGLISALFFSISLPVIIRGSIGWFKSEPLGLFFGILAIYLFFSGIKSENQKISFMKLIPSGIFFVFSLSSWGGSQFFIMTLGVFFLVLPFVRKDIKFLIWSIPIFTISTIITSLAFERLAVTFVTGLGGLSLIIPTLFLVICIIIQNKSNDNSKIRNGLFFLTGFIIISSSLLIINFNEQFLPLPTYRYLNAINPFMITSDPLIDSVSEHATTSIEQSFLFHSVLMIFAGIGIWLLLKNLKRSNLVENDMISFSLIFGLMGIYISSAFIRLEVFASLSIIVLSSIGLSILFKEFSSNMKENSKTQNITIKSSFFVGVMILLIIPLSLPNTSLFTFTDHPPTILNGATRFPDNFSDWNDSLTWIKENTPNDSVIAAWWDYGYWIQTKAERASLADNSTLIDHVIKKIANTFLSTPDEGWSSLQEMNADYFVIFIASERLQVTGQENQAVYLLGGGGDEAKKQWFMRIANEPISKYVYNDGISGTDYFWNETLMGNMIPFEVLGYINPQTNEQSLTYQPGYLALYEKSIKFPKDRNGPLKLVYSSPSFDRPDPGPMVGIYVYEINKDYVPIN